MKNWHWILILGGAAVLLYLIMKNSGSSSGVAFAAPNPQSVAAVEGGTAAEIQSNNDLIMAKANMGTQLLTSYYNGMFTTRQTQLNDAAAVSINGQNADAAVKIATVTNATNRAIAAENYAQNLSAMQYAANAAKNQTAAQEAVASQAIAAQTPHSSFWDWFGNFLQGQAGNLLAMFGLGGGGGTLYPMGGQGIGSAVPVLK